MLGGRGRECAAASGSSAAIPSARTGAGVPRWVGASLTPGYCAPIARARTAATGCWSSRRGAACGSDHRDGCRTANRRALSGKLQACARRRRWAARSPSSEWTIPHCSFATRRSSLKSGPMPRASGVYVRVYDVFQRRPILAAGSLTVEDRSRDTHARWPKSSPLCARVVAHPPTPHATDDSFPGGLPRPGESTHSERWLNG